MTDTTTMPLGRYFAFVGSLLLALLFLADWCLPKPVEPARHEARPSGIRIASVAKWPERVVYDTSRPTIVPPPQPMVIAAEAPIAALPRDAFAMATPVAKPAAPVQVHKKAKAKIATQMARRQNRNWVAVYQPPPMRMGWAPEW